MLRITRREPTLSSLVLGGMLLGLLGGSLPGRLHAGQPSAPVMPVPPLGSQSTPVIKPEAPGGALQVWLQAGRIGERRGMYPPAELLLTDPRGRKIGTDPRRNREYDEIPDKAYYVDEESEDDETGEAGPVTKALDVPRPLAGTYQLQVIGTTRGKYDLTIRGFVRELRDGSGKDFSEVPIQKGQVHTYVIKYSREVGVEIEIKRRP